MMSLSLLAGRTVVAGVFSPCAQVCPELQKRIFVSVSSSDKITSSIGDRELIIATYPTNQKLRGAPRLLFGNGCF